MKYSIEKNIKMKAIHSAKPFLKWAGGKTQLIKKIENVLPKNILKKKFTYIEPFVGSGAVLFWILNNFPKLEKAVIYDNFFDDLYSIFNIQRIDERRNVNKNNLDVPCGRVFSSIFFICSSQKGFPIKSPTQIAA